MLKEIYVLICNKRNIFIQRKELRPTIVTLIFLTNNTKSKKKKSFLQNISNINII